jgi:hypothetical protein
MVSFSQPSVRESFCFSVGCATKVVALLSSAARRRLLGPPVPLRWRSAHASRPSVSRWSWLSQQATLRLPLLAARGKVLPLSRRSAMVSHIGYSAHPGSDLAAFEATIEHARMVLHQSPCFCFRSESAVHPPHQRSHVLAAHLEPLGSKQVAQHACAGERQFQVQLVALTGCDS